MEDTLPEQRYNEIMTKLEQGQYNAQQQAKAEALRKKYEIGLLTLTDSAGQPIQSPQQIKLFERQPRTQATRVKVRLPLTGLQMEMGPKLRPEVRQEIAERAKQKKGVGVYGELKALHEAQKEVFAKLPEDEIPMDPRGALAVRALNSALLGLPSADEDFRELVAQAGEDSPVASGLGDILGFLLPGAGYAKGGKAALQALPAAERVARGSRAGRGLSMAGAGATEAALYEATTGETVRAAERGEFPTMAERGRAATDPVALALGAGTGGVIGAALPTAPRLQETRFPEGYEPPSPAVAPPEPTGPLDEAAQAIDQRVAEMSGRAKTEAEVKRIAEDFRAAATGDKTATSRLAKSVQTNPEIVKIADTLGIDMPIEALTDNTQLKQALADLARMTGPARAAFTRKVSAAAERADTLLREIDAVPDVSGIDYRIRARHDEAISAIKKQETELYQKQLNKKAPPSTETQPTNLIELLRRRASELGGPDELKGFERAFYKKHITNEQPITLGKIKDLKTEISANTKLYADADSFLKDSYLAALRADEMDGVRSIGDVEAENILKSAHQLTTKRKNLEAQVQTLYGRKGEGSIAGLLKSALKTGPKAGDISKLNRLINNVPPEMVEDAILTGISSLARDARGNFSFSQFNTIMSQIEGSSRINNLVKSKLGADNVKRLEMLNKISERIAGVTREQTQTGLGLTPIVQAIKQEQTNIIADVVNGPGRRFMIGGLAGAATGGNAPAAILASSVLKNTTRKKPTDLTNAAADLLDDPDFIELVTSMGRELGPDEIALNKAINAAAYKKWAKVAGIAEPETWLINAVAGQRAALTEEEAEQ